MTIVNHRLLDEAVRRMTTRTWRAMFTRAVMPADRWLDHLRLWPITVGRIKVCYALLLAARSDLSIGLMVK